MHVLGFNSRSEEWFRSTVKASGVMAVSYLKRVRVRVLLMICWDDGWLMIWG